MSSFGTFITIKNDLPTELFNGTSNVTQGKLVGKLPVTVASDGATSQIQVDSENGDDGSAGSFTYNVVIGGNTRQVSINFVCNNALQNSVTAGSPTPSIIKVEVSSYSEYDHPLRATVTLGAVQVRAP